jgi:hypothetical protein
MHGCHGWDKQQKAKQCKPNPLLFYNRKKGQEKGNVFVKNKSFAFHTSQRNNKGVGLYSLLQSPCNG